MDIVEGMNEVYVTGPSRENEKFNSDQIFYTKHVDGPWGLFPFVSVYRCIVGMDRNLTVRTVINAFISARFVTGCVGFLRRRLTFP